ncbi:TFIIH/NER complex subunit [Blyttiomyces sp. JEL0837]|nr:TFIIH/NER complex subunit [Blyttiomyces sp. JEL0837]
MDKGLDICPVCRADRYLNPALRLLVSPCYHKILFLAGPAPCPICKQTLRKSNFVAQTFEDLRVEKEVQIRKKVGKYLNKRLEDFGGDLRKFNDYLEEVEMIMFNLINDIDVQATNEKIEKFRQDNKELIASNMNKQRREDDAISTRLKREREEKQIRKEAYLVHQLQEARAKKAEREEFIDQLASSDLPADAILDSFRKKHGVNTSEFAPMTFHSSTWEDEENATAMVQDEGEFSAMDVLYVDPIQISINQSYDDTWTRDLATDKKARGAGYMPQWTYTRSILSAFTAIMEGV